MNSRDMHGVSHSTPQNTSQCHLSLLKPWQGVFKSSKKQVDTCQTSLQNWLSCSEKISDEEEAWLDHAGNIIDHHRILNTLSNAKNLEDAVNQLGDANRIYFQELQAAGGEKVKATLKIG